MPDLTSPSRSRIAASLLLTVLVVTLGACGGSGRDMVPPAEGATAPTRSTSSTFAPISSRPTPLLTSPDFKTGAALPDKFGCNSVVPPSLEWSTLPAGTTEVVLAMYALKPSADLHWLVVGIPAQTRSFTGTLPAGAQELANSFGGTGWSGPCVPADQTQSFQFEVLAMRAPAVLNPTLQPVAQLQALEAQAVDGRGFLPVTVNPVPRGTSVGTGSAGSGSAGSGPLGTRPEGSIGGPSSSPADPSSKPDGTTL